MNVNNPDDFEKYKKMYFTDKGYKIFENLLKNFIILYMENNDYPIKVKAFLGIPLFDYVVDITSDKELLGRIKILANMLGIKDISFTTQDNKMINFEMSGKYTIQ